MRGVSGRAGPGQPGARAAPRTAVRQALGELGGWQLVPVARLRASFFFFLLQTAERGEAPPFRARPRGCPSRATRRALLPGRRRRAWRRRPVGLMAQPAWLQPR